MLRSLGLLLLLVTASVARDLTAALTDDLDYKVWMVRQNHAEEDCDAVDGDILLQMHESATSSTGGIFKKNVQREKDNGRKLRTGVSPRELGYCDENCRCHRILMCQIGGYCADSCHPCECSYRHLEELPEFFWEVNVESSPAVVEVAGEGAGKVSAGIQRGGEEVCPEWDNKQDYTVDEIDEIMTCATSKALKEMARSFKNDGNNCLGDPDLLVVHVEIY
jgi:hypothetical protein